MLFYLLNLFVKYLNAPSQALLKFAGIRYLNYKEDTHSVMVNVE